MNMNDVVTYIGQIIESNKKGRYITLNLKGDTGSGKTATVKRAAEVYGFPLFNLQATIKDTVDFSGVPRVQNNMTYFAAPGWLPRERVFLFIDELAQADKAMKNILCGVIYDRAIGDWEAHPETVVITASNRLEDRAGVTRNPRQMDNRLNHITMVPDLTSWIENYAIPQKVDARILAFLSAPSREEYIYMPSMDKDAFPTLRTWEHADTILKMELAPHIRNEALMGAIGEGMAGELIHYLKVCDKMVSVKEVFTNPKKAPIPDEADIYTLLMSQLASQVNHDTIHALVIYLERCNEEMANSCVHMLCAQHPELNDTKQITDWRIKHRV